MKMRVVLAALALIALGAAAGETHTVMIEGMKFQPETLTVKQGDTVVWRNTDVVPHTATLAGGFDSGLIAPGASWSWTAGQAGRVDYVCTYHPGMKAAVVVQ
jgi:plastocyanin